MFSRTMFFKVIIQIVPAPHFFEPMIIFYHGLDKILSLRRQKIITLDDKILSKVRKILTKRDNELNYWTNKE